MLMKEKKTSKPGSERILVLALTARDASLSQAVLKSVGITSSAVLSAGELCEELAAGAGAILLPEEAVEMDDAGLLFRYLAKQPAWSDVPILVMTKGGADSTNALKALEHLGNAILLERPVRINTLVSTARVALRARSRQYEIQRLLLENEESEAELKRSGHKLKEEAERLSRSNLELEQFAYVCSHDLQEPLRKMANFSQLLTRKFGENLGEDGRRHLESISEGAIRMGNLISDLLTFSRLSREDDEQAPVDLSSILSRVLVDLELTVAEKKAVITFVPLPVVVGNESQLHHVFLNLLSNALKFQAEDPPKIHVGAVTENGLAHVVVSDNGIGFDPAYSRQVFEIFKRLHPKSHFQGTGVGLAICKKVIEQNGGQIWAESALGAGSTFHFTLPLPGKIQSK